MPILKNRKTYIPVHSDLTLFHIVAFNKTSFAKKIKNYVKQMEYREHVIQQGGGVVRDYPGEYTDDEWLWYIGNFRVNNPDQHYEVKKENFIENMIFSHLDADLIRDIRDRIIACEVTPKQKATPEEKEYLRYKTNDRDVLENVKWFRIIPEDEIITVIPDSQA